jgi:nicotinate-nucleotide adenylyltransferase
MSRRIGFLSGSFDPVHRGHIVLAKQAALQAGLDQVYLIPEASPRRKENVAPLTSRVRMLELATSIYPELAILLLPDEHLSPVVTVPELQSRFPGAELLMILGSDMLEHMPEWKGLEYLSSNMGLIIGYREGTDRSLSKEQFKKLPPFKQKPLFLIGQLPLASSSVVKASLKTKGHSDDLSPSVEDYIKELGLYNTSI